MFNLGQHIHSLLFTHDCIIVPGLGGFITQYKAAEYDTYNHKASPACKQLAFNAKLNNNDGVLTNTIASELNLPHAEALELIKDEVDKVIAILNEKGNLNIAPLGTFYKSADGPLIFVASLSLNYDIKSYGLKPIRLKTLARVETIASNSTTAEPIKELSKVKRVELQERRQQKETAAAGKGLSLINTLGSVFMLAILFALFNMELGNNGLSNGINHQANIIESNLNAHQTQQAPTDQTDIRTLLSDYQQSMESVNYKILLDGTFSRTEVENIQAEISQNYPQSKIIEVENNEYTISVISFMNPRLAEEYRDLIQKNFPYQLIITAK